MNPDKILHAFIVLLICFLPTGAETKILPQVVNITADLENEGCRLSIPSVKILDTAIENAGRLLISELGEKVTLPEAVDSINAVVYGRWGIGFDPDGKDLNGMFPQSVFGHKKGNCLGVALLILSLGERIGCPLYGVLLPGHIFIRFDNGKERRNMEPNRNGIFHPDDYYRERYLSSASSWYNLRNISVDEVIAVLRFNIANSLASLENFRLAEKYYLKCLESFGAYAEAWGNLALMYQKEGDISRAGNAFTQAEKIRPDMYNLALNRGIFELNNGNKHDALLTFKRGLKYYPNDTNLLEIYNSTLNGSGRSR